MVLLAYRYASVVSGVTSKFLERHNYILVRVLDDKYLLNTTWPSIHGDVVCHGYESS